MVFGNVGDDLRNASACLLMSAQERLTHGQAVYMNTLSETTTQLVSLSRSLSGHGNAWCLDPGKS